MFIMIAFIIYSDTAFDYEIQGFDHLEECQEAQEEIKAHYPQPDAPRVYSVCLESEE